MQEYHKKLIKNKKKFPLISPKNIDQLKNHFKNKD